MSIRVGPLTWDNRATAWWVSAILTTAVLIGLLVVALSFYGALVVLLLLVFLALFAVNGAPLWAFLLAYPVVQQIETGLSGPKALALVCLSSWILGVLAGTQTFSLRLFWIDLTVVLLFAVFFASILTHNQQVRVSALQVYGQNLCLYFIARTVAGTLPGLRASCWSLVVGGAAASLVVIWQYGHGGYVLWATGGATSQRLSVQGIGTNNFATILLAALGAALGLLVLEEVARRKMVLSASILFLFGAVLLAESRGAFFGLIVLLVVGALALTSWKRILSLLGVGALGLGLMLPGPAAAIGLGGYATRLQTLTNGSALESERVYLWQMAIEALREQPITGLGVGNFVQPDVWYPLALRTHIPLQFVISGVDDVHSFYLGIAADVGLIGVVPLVALLLLSAISLRRALNRAKGWAAPALSGPMYAVALSALPYFVAVAFVPAQDDALPWLLLGLIGGAVQASYAVRRQVCSANDPGLHLALLSRFKVNSSHSRNGI